MSACIPAPAPESEPATVRTRGTLTVVVVVVVNLSFPMLANVEEAVGYACFKWQNECWVVLKIGNVGRKLELKLARFAPCIFWEPF
jgi:hypothetical protein